MPFKQTYGNLELLEEWHIIHIIKYIGRNYFSLLVGFESQRQLLGGML